MADLSKVIKMKKADFQTMVSQGSVTIGGHSYTYDSTALYAVVDDYGPNDHTAEVGKDFDPQQLDVYIPSGHCVDPSSIVITFVAPVNITVQFFGNPVDGYTYKVYCANTNNYEIDVRGVQLNNSHNTISFDVYAGVPVAYETAFQIIYQRVAYWPPAVFQ